MEDQVAIGLLQLLLLARLFEAAEIRPHKWARFGVGLSRSSWRSLTPACPADAELSFQAGQILRQATFGAPAVPVFPLRPSASSRRGPASAPNEGLQCRQIGLHALATRVLRGV